MKLYLSSNRVGANSDALRNLVASGDRAALIFNSLDVYGDSRMRDAPTNVQDLAALGFHCEELDLRQYFGDLAGLTARIDVLDLVWVVGGNTFGLARAMSHSRFGEALAPALSTERVVYGGYSAGACVTGPDLQGCHLMDEPRAKPHGYPEGYGTDITAETLKLVPWRVIPHWRSDHEESPLAEIAAEHLQASGLEYRTLSDGQAIVVDGDLVQLV